MTSEHYYIIALNILAIATGLAVGAIITTALWPDGPAPGMLISALACLGVASGHAITGYLKRSPQ